VSQLPKPKFLEFISPAGAGIILICFFLPWLKVSCGGKNVILSGSNIGGIFWLIFGLAVVALVISIIFRQEIKIRLVKSTLLACSFVSAAIILYKYIAVAVDPDIPFYVPSSMVHFELKPGAIGIMLGLLMIFSGAPLIGEAKSESSKSDKTLSANPK